MAPKKEITSQESEVYDVKYVRELLEYWNTYMYALINEIYVGVGVSLGLSEKQAYKLAKNNPVTMAKAGFFTTIFDKFKSIFSHKIPRFRPPKKILGDGKKPMTPAQWNIFNKTLGDYWTNNADNVAEDVTVKGYLLGRGTTGFIQKDKPYKNKSLYQIDYDQYDGGMPNNIRDAYNNYDFTNSEKNALNRSLSDVAMYVTQASNDVQEAIREKVTAGIEDGKSGVEIASDLYWDVEKDKGLKNKHTAESMRRNWLRVGKTETAMVYEAGILAPYEGEAAESLMNPKKAQYFVRTGGTCDWCQSKQGTLVRLVPTSVVSDRKNESLSAMGIKDPNTDIAIWIGKNNVGLKKAEWMISAPAHPYNVATFSPIDIEDEYYNDKTDSVDKRQKKSKHIPAMKDYSYQSEEEQEYRKPTFISADQVRYNNNIYERVDPDDYVQKKALWDRDPSLPVPMSTDSTRYDKIFGAAERE